MEHRLLTDPEYGREFDTAVDQIIDRYVAGEFRGTDLDQVRNYFLKSEQRQEKLRFALALKEQKERSRVVGGRGRKRFTSYLAIAASFLAIIGIGFFAWRASRTNNDLQEGLVALQQAFREERPIEGRLSDFNYVPLPNQRGGGEKVDYMKRDTAAALLLKALRDNPTASSHHAAAKYYLMLRQFEEANKEFTTALTLEPQNAKIHSDFGAALLEEGWAQTSKSDNSRQLELYGRSLEQIQKALQLDPSLLEALFNRALVYQFMSPSDQAKEAWNAYLQKDSSSRWADEARRNLKLIDQEQKKTLSGQNDHDQQFLTALRNSDDERAWKIVSANYTSAGNEITNRLLDSLLNVETFAERLEPRETLAALQYVAKLENDHTGDRFTLDLVNHYSRAGPSSRSLLAKARQHMRTAYSSFKKSKFLEAIDEYNAAKSIYVQAQDNVGTAFVEYRLAHCYVLRPDTQRARNAFRRLLTIYETNQYRWLIAQCLYGLANANADSSEYSKAIDYSAQALAKFQEFGDANGVLKCLTQLADFNQAINRIPTALGYLNRTLSLTQQITSDTTQRWGVLNQIGFSMTSLGLHAAALFYQKEALKLAKELNVPLLISRSYSYLGSAYAAMRMYPQAVNEATQAFEYGGSVTGKRGLEVKAHASQQLGDIHRAAQRCDQAIENYDTSLELYRKINIDYYSYAAHKGKLQCFITNSNQEAVRKEFELVLGLSELYRSRITDENQRSNFFDAEQEVYDLAIDYEFSVEQNSQKAFEYSEKSRARSLLDAVERSGQIRAKRKTASRESAVVTPSLRVSEIQAKMPEAAQLVEYAVLNDKLIIWVVTKNGINQEQLRVNAEEFNDTINAFLEAVSHPPNDVTFKRDRSIELFETLVKPIEKYLDKNKVLVIIPDKILNYLPFAALTSPRTSTYLIEDYEMSVAPSATLFVALSATAERLGKRTNEHLVSVGDPLFDRKTFKSLRQLPASLAEAREVAERYPAHHKLLVRDEATETTVKREIEKADLIHLAMHFVLNEQSEMLSGFPLTPERSDTASNQSDGFLQSFEIAHLNLRRTRLAVLSACQTGIEKQYRGEGAVGAARPFFVAGVPTVVASLWPVDSDASAELMVSFHRHRLDRLSTAQALRLAQIEMFKSSDARHHPYYWAPFLPIGGIARY
ncbi:MAG TPA: CHAT domain-containing protein [Pyrinomonadaceae bacterium]|nr:CHAT domain-containing protein [Pyrinomonadaceae bacterium]